MGTSFKHRGRRLAACALIAGSSIASAHAAGAPTTGRAITLRPLSLVKLRDLEFGTNASGAAAGTVSIDPFTDGRSTTGGVIAAGGAPQAAQFYTYGGPRQNVQVNRGPFPIMNRAGGGATMTLDQLTLNGPVLRFLDNAGLLDLRVGGRLIVAANQLPGSYAGNFQIIVTYF